MFEISPRFTAGFHFMAEIVEISGAERAYFQGQGQNLDQILISGAKSLKICTLKEEILANRSIRQFQCNLAELILANDPF